MMKPFLCALAAGVPLLCACSRPVQPPEPPRPVVVVRLAPTALSSGALYAGEVRARHESELAFRISGKIIERRVDVGSRVKPGQLLARLDPSDAGLNLEAARAQLAAATTELALARAEVERYRELVGKGFVSRSVLDARESAFKSASARVAQTRAQAEVAGNQAAYTRLLADQAGVITALTAEVGQVVKDSAVVVKLARDGAREVLIALPESRVGTLHVGDALEVRLDGRPEPALHGRVREIAPSADPATRTFAVRVSILDPLPELQLGMSASVAQPDAAAAAGALRVPASAVFEQQGRSAVWVMRPEGRLVRPQLRPVEVGQYREDGVLIRGGLAPGEMIAAAGVHKIVAGSLLQPLEAGRPAAAAGEPAR